MAWATGPQKHYFYVCQELWKASFNETSCKWLAWHEDKTKRSKCKKKATEGIKKSVQSDWSHLMTKKNWCAIKYLWLYMIMCQHQRSMLTWMCLFKMHSTTCPFIHIPLINWCETQTFQQSENRSYYSCIDLSKIMERMHL